MTATASAVLKHAAQSIDRFFAHVERLLAIRSCWIAAATSVMALQIWHVLTHIHWFDEWQALLIAVQSPDISALLENLRYEGHPPLWYLLLRGIAPHLPWQHVLTTAQFFIAIALQAIILFRSPFGRVERLLIGLSYFILFEFGALSRSLSLGALLTVAFFAARGRIVAWIIVILLPAIDFQFGLFSLVTIILLIRDHRWSTVGFLLWAVVSLVSFWTVLPADDMMTNQGGLLAAALKLIDDFSALLIPVQTINNQIGWSGGWPWGLGFIGGPLFILFSLAVTRDVALHRWLYRAFLIAICAFSLSVYSLSIRHLTLAALLVILFKWREVESGRSPGALFRLWLFVAALGGISVTAISATRPFDSAPQVATFIRAHGLENKNWVAWRPERGMSVGVYLDRETAMLKGGCLHSFIRWNFHDDIRTESALVDALHLYVARYGRSYLLTSLRPEFAKDPILHFLAGFPAGYDGYVYYLYVVSPELPETGRIPPPCPPVRRSL
jgi:hypothetical protein